MATYNIREDLPTVEEYRSLRELSGLDVPPQLDSEIESALTKSLLCLIARSESEKAIGMVRLSGDGHIFLLLTDMCVLPDWQGRGIGSALMDRLLNWVDENYPKACITLHGDPPAMKMYRKRGFKEPGESVTLVARWWGKES